MLKQSAFVNMSIDIPSHRINSPSVVTHMNPQKFIDQEIGEARDPEKSTKEENGDSGANVDFNLGSAKFS